MGFRRKAFFKRFSAFLFAVFFLGVITSYAQAPYRYDARHEDTVRVLILYNTAIGSNPAGDCPSPGPNGITEGGGLCYSGTHNFGTRARDMVTTAIEGINPANIIVMQTDLLTSWTMVENFWPGMLPHVIVHIQAGWYTCNGGYIVDILQQAVDNAVGVVSIGDDAAWTARDVFGFTQVANNGAPMGWGGDYEPLWIEMDRGMDTLQDPGIVRNTVDHILNGNKLFFKPYATDGRCTADADVFTAAPAYLDHLFFFGSQRGIEGGDTTGNLTPLTTQNFNAISAFGSETRRGVNLSFEPQFIENETAAWQIIYDAIIWASFARWGFTLPPPYMVPPSTSFPFQQSVTIQHILPTAGIYYQVNGGGFQLYTNQPIVFTATTVIDAYAAQPGWINSDTVSQTYTKLPGNSQLTLRKPDGTLLGGTVYLSEIENSFVIEIQTAYPELTEIYPAVLTLTAGDQENVTLSSPQLVADALVFTGTQSLTFAAASASDGSIQSSPYDTLWVGWNNPINTSDVVAASVIVRPQPQQSLVYFSDAAGNPLGADLTGNETVLYVVVEDQTIDPSRAAEYVVTIQNIPLPGVNLGIPDVETTGLTLLGPGSDGRIKYLATIPLSQGAAAPGDGTLQAILQDQITASYADPVDLDNNTAQVGFGIRTELPGILVFTNSDYTLPLTLAAGGLWDASQNAVYLQYTDDSLDVSITKKSYHHCPEHRRAW
ncbi:chitobiase/beta-hexosaminidase C-terminal domain-containing protein [Fibrobacterota bacterium]